MRRTISTAMRGVVGASATALVAGGLAAVTAMPAAAAGTTVHVGPSGTNSPGCGASADPCNTVQQGVDHAAPGDTVSIAAGTYTENVDVDAGVMIVGAGNGTASTDTIISGSLDFTGMPTGEAATVQNLRVQLNGSSGIIATHDLTVDGVVLDYNGVLNYELLASHPYGGPHGVSQAGGGPAVADVSNITIENSTFIGGNTGGWDSMIHLGGGTGTVAHVHIDNVDLQLEDKAAGIALDGVTGDDIVLSGVTTSHTNSPGQNHQATGVYLAAADHDDLHVSVSDSTFTDVGSGVTIVPAVQSTTTNGTGPEYELSGITTTAGVGVHVTPPSGAAAADPATVRGMTVTGSDLSHGHRGLYLDGGDAMEVSGLTVTDSHFDDNSWGGFTSALTGDDALTGMTVTGSTFNDNAYKGIYITGASDALFEDVTVNGSGNAPDGAKTWPGAGIDLSLKHGAYSDIALKNVQVSGSGGMNDGYGLGVRPHSGGTVDGVTVTGGAITGSPTGVFLEADPQGFAGTPVLRCVDLSGNANAAIDTTTGGFTVDANDNYWGSANPDFGALIKGQGTVQHDTWLTSAPTSACGGGDGTTGSLGSLSGSLGSLGSLSGSLGSLGS